MPYTSVDRICWWLFNDPPSRLLAENKAEANKHNGPSMFQCNGLTWKRLLKFKTERGLRKFLETEYAIARVKG